MCRSRWWSVASASVVLVLALVTPVLTGCESADGSATGTVKITAADAARTVTLAKGQKLEVTLESNATTGFSWQVKDDGGLLKLDGQPAYEAPNTGLVGAGGRETFTFTAHGTGSGTLVLEYRRPWEKGVPAEKTFEVPVTVR